jgi:TRAP-type uncharacterized transport system substrate-binding protein
MKRMIFASMALVAISSMPALADDVTLCAGGAGRGYDKVFQAVAVELKERGHNAKVLNLKGSEDIINAIVAGRCQYGAAQGDIYYKMSKDNPSVGSALKPIDILYDEVATLVCSKDSGYDELSDISAGDTIIVDSLGTGSAMTWETMVAIEKEYGGSNAWSQAVPEYIPLSEAGAALALGNAKCAFGVGSAPINWATEIENDGGVAEVYDKDLNDLEFNGKSVYIAIDMPDGAYKTAWDTYKIPAVLFRGGAITNPEIDSMVKRAAKATGRKLNTVK